MSVLRQLLSLLLLCALISFGCSVFPAQAAPDAAAIFELHCAGCHIKGGNIVRRGKTLQLPALQRNGVDTVEAIATLVAQGKGNMSAYQDRLTPEQIQAVSAYVLEQAQKHWKE